LDVEPVVNASLMNAVKDPCDGLICIQTFSWTTFATQITSGLVGNFQWQIPVSVTSLKSLFFVMTDQTMRQDMNYLNTQFQHCGLLQYRVVIGGLPLNADWVNVYNKTGQNTFSESLYALMEAWSVHHKTDGCPSLITPENYCPGRFDPVTGFYQSENTAIFGQELESFNQKSGIIQSGINTMQTTFVLELQFAPAEEQRHVNIGADGGEEIETIRLYGDKYYELRAFCMYDKVIAFDENNGSIRAEY